jgi:small GTP-binding protein
MAEHANLIRKVARPSSNSRVSLDSELSSEEEEEDLVWSSSGTSPTSTRTRTPETVVGGVGEGRNALTVVEAKTSGLTPPPRLGCSTVVRRDTYMYVYGGAMTDVMPASVCKDDSVYRLNIATMQWRPLDNAGDSTPGGRFGHTLSLFQRDAMILFGGMHQSSASSSSAPSSSSSTTSTTSTSSRATRWKPSTPKQQMFLEGLPQLQLAEDDHHLWLLNVIDRTDAEAAVWSQLSTPGPSPSSRLHHTSTYVPFLNSLVVFGGTRPGEALNDLWVLNTKEMTWSQPETTGTPPTPRFGHTATLPLSPMERLNADERIVLKGKNIETTTTAATDHSNEDALGRTANDKTTLIIMGGFSMSANGTPKHVDTYTTGTMLHLYDVKSMAWSQPKCFGSIPPPVGFHSSSMTGGDTHVLVYGGETSMSMSLGHGGGAPFVLDRLRWLWSRPQYNGADNAPPSLHSTVTVMNKPVTYGGVCKTIINANGRRLKEPRVETSDRLCLFNTVTLSTGQNGSSSGGHSSNSSSSSPTSKAQSSHVMEKFKLIIVGDSGVGKSNLLMRFADDHFEQNSQATIGVDFKSCVTACGSRQVRVMCWDTAGQERYTTITSNYYRGADAALFVYDATRPETVANLPKWFNAVREHCGDDVPCLVVANKLDVVAEMETNPGENNTSKLLDDMRVAREKAHALAQREKMPLMETSARTSEGVDSVFLTITARYLSSKAGRMKAKKVSKRRQKASSVGLNKNNGNGGGRDKKNCC